MDEVNSAGHILAADQRLSDSLLWQMQRAYFERAGMRAWQDDVVPHAISSNPLLARAYARVVLGYLRDCVAAGVLDGQQPVYLVELGAGSGRLAYHFVVQFQEMLAQSPLAGVRMCYVLTDFVPQMVDFWRQQPKLAALAAAGWMDFALWDVQEMERPLTLQQAQITLTPEQVGNPLILVANYFFDSIPQDSFALVDGQLCENLLTLLSSQPEPDLADETIWQRLELAYEAIPLVRPYYAEPIYDQILQWYEDYLPDTVLTFPNVGLDCVRYWQRWGNGRLLLLTSDRGYTLPETLVDQDDPLPNLHGSFSLMVNYHALGQYVQLVGGRVLHPPHYQDQLQVLACLLGDVPQGGQETSLAFSEAVTQGGPDDFFALRQALEPHLETLTLPQLLSYLRLSGWDAELLRDVYPVLRRQVGQAGPAWFEDVAAVLHQIEQLYLPLGHNEIAHLIRQLLDEMGWGERDA